jgi:AcrR family transcriptional regulator
VSSEGNGRGDRRSDLLAAAAHRFVEVGIRATTMEDVARGARAGKATLYRYFANKDAVLDALLEREAERLERRLREAADAAPTCAAAVEAAYVAGVDFYVTHPMLTRGRDEEPGLILPRITSDGGTHLGTLLDFFARLIARGVDAGEFRGVEPRQAAEVVVRLMLSYFAFPPMEVDVTDEEQSRAFAHALVAGGLRSRR